MIVFDDSSHSGQAKYYPSLEQTTTHNDLYYVGPREKEQFLAYLHKRLRDKRLESLVKDLFRPSYGANRNFTLMYMLGGLMVSADDDMRPYTVMEDSPESLEVDEICRGKLVKAGCNGHTRQSPRSRGSGRFESHRVSQGVDAVPPPLFKSLCRSHQPSSSRASLTKALAAHLKVWCSTTGAQDSTTPGPKH